MCDFLARFGMHVYAGVFLVLLFLLIWILLGMTMFFNLAFPFQDSLEVMGSHVLVELDCGMDSKLSEAHL